MLQQGLLLLFIEGLDLIQVQQHTVGGQEGIQLGNDLLDIGGGGRGGVELIKGPVGLLGNDVGHGGLSRAAGAIEHHVGNVPGVDQAAQNGPLPQNMLLAVDLIQAGGPQQVGKWLIHSDCPF